MVKEIARCAAVGKEAEYEQNQPANDGNWVISNKPRILQFNTTPNIISALIR
jgi:hypothetical protein